MYTKQTIFVTKQSARNKNTVLIKTMFSVQSSQLLVGPPIIEQMIFASISHIYLVILNNHLFIMFICIHQHQFYIYIYALKIPYANIQNSKYTSCNCPRYGEGSMYCARYQYHVRSG